MTALATPPQARSLGPVKFQAEQTGSIVALPTELEVDERRMGTRILFADGNTQDGVGDRLRIEGIRLWRHQANPVVLYEHGKAGVTLPVALSEDPDTKAYTCVLDEIAQQGWGFDYFYQGKGIAGAQKGEDYDHAVFCEQLFHLICKRFVRGGSIGYQVIQAQPMPPDYSGTNPPVSGADLISILKLEHSVVVIPANGLTVKTAPEWKDWREAAREILCMPKLCGKSLAMPLRKTLEPYAAEGKSMSNGVETKGVSIDSKLRTVLGDLASDVRHVSNGNYYIVISDKPDAIVRMLTAYGWDSNASITKISAGVKVEVKAMSAYDTTQGGALVKPPQQGAKADMEREEFRTVHSESGWVISERKDPFNGSLVYTIHEADDPPRGQTLRSLDEAKRKLQEILRLRGTKDIPQDTESPVAVPAGNLTETNVPPSRWKPGVGAEKMKQIRMKYRAKSFAEAKAIYNLSRDVSIITGGERTPYEFAVTEQIGYALLGSDDILEYRGRWDGTKITWRGMTPESSVVRLVEQHFATQGKSLLKRGKSIKSISVRYKRKVVKGYANIQMKFDTAGMNTDQQNGFVKEMKAAGFGHPSGGKWSGEGDEKKLDAPLKAANYSFDLEPGKNLAEAIGKATGIGERHGAKYMGNSKSMPKDQLIRELEKKEFFGTADRLRRGVIDEEQAEGELRGTKKPAPSPVSGPPDPHEFAAKMRSQGVGRQESWSRWVQATSMRPGMDAKDWYRIYDSMKSIGVSATSSQTMKTKSVLRRGDRVARIGDPTRGGTVLTEGALINVRWDSGESEEVPAHQLQLKTKSGAQTMKTKSADQPADAEMPEEAIETKDGPAPKEFHMEESLGSQVLKRMHQDHSLIMGQYDEILPVLDHPEVKSHVEDMLKAHEKLLGVTEKLHKKHFKDVSPIEGAMDDKEDGQKKEEKDHLPSEADNAQPADSDPVEEPTPDEVVEGMEKEDEETPEEKALRIKQTKSIRKKYRAKSVDDKKDEEDEDKKDKAAPTDGTDAFPDDQDGVKWFKGLAEHHQGNAVGAKGYLKELSETQDGDFGDEHRMKAYHHAANLEGIETKEGEAAPPPPPPTVPDVPPSTPGPEYIGDSMRTRGKDLTEDEADKIKDEMIEQADDNVQEKGLRGAVKAAAQYLKSVSTSQQFGEDQRQKALSCCDGMKGIDDEESVEEPTEEDAGMQTKSFVAYQEGGKWYVHDTDDGNSHDYDLGPYSGQAEAERVAREVDSKSLQQQTKAIADLKAKSLERRKQMEELTKAMNGLEAFVMK